jgi:hypothetical protein
MTQMTEVQAIEAFVTAGNATFTLLSSKTGQRFTFLVRKKEESEVGPWFVSVLTGPNNSEDFEFLGTIFSPDAFRHGKKSRVSTDAPSAKAFAWFWGQLAKSVLPSVCSFYHEGRCGRCGRKLTTPESVQRGLGPVCASMYDAA